METCTTRSTRSSRSNEVRKTHRQTSEMHLAISLKDLTTIEKLINEKEEKLCTGDGLNCFIVAMMTNNSPSKITFIKKLLEIEPLGVHAKNTDGYCLLLYFISDLNFVKFLLELGADPSAQSNEKGSALMCAVNKLECKGNNHPPPAIFTETEEVVKTLINAGANILAVDRNGCTVLCHLISIAVQQTQACNLLEYVLNQAPFQSETLHLFCTAHLTLQTMLLQGIKTWKWSPAHDLIFNSRFKSINAVYMAQIHTCHTHYLPVNAISYVINYSLRSPIKVLQYVPEFIDKLISHGFEISNPRVVSPLTILMFQTYYNCETDIFGYKTRVVEKQISVLECIAEYSVEHLRLRKELSEKMIEHGVNVQQQVLCDNDDRLLQRRRDLNIPDALWIAFLHNNFPMVDILLPHCVCVPLSLLLTYTEQAPQSIASTLIWLQKYGPVPHGTKIYQDLLVLLQTKASKKANSIFQTIHSSPLSLQELCRYEVRSSFGEAVLHPENTLSGVVSKAVPILLHNYIMSMPMHTPSKPHRSLMLEAMLPDGVFDEIHVNL